MRKADFIELVAQKSGMTKKDVDIAVDAFCAVVGDLLADGDKLSLPGFGTFEVRERAARKGRNIHTGEATDIPACRVPLFRPNTQLKGRVNGNAAG